MLSGIYVWESDRDEEGDIEEIWAEKKEGLSGHTDYLRTSDSYSSQNPKSKMKTGNYVAAFTT